MKTQLKAPNCPFFAPHCAFRGVPTMPKWLMWSESSVLKTDLQMINFMQTLRSVFTTRKVFSHNNQQTITLCKHYEPRKFSCVSSLCVILMALSQPGKFVGWGLGDDSVDRIQKGETQLPFFFTSFIRTSRCPWKVSTDSFRLITSQQKMKDVSSDTWCVKRCNNFHKKRLISRLVC